MTDTSSAHDHPDLPQNDVSRFGIPGTPDFFASVLRFVRTTAPGVPLDPVIFQSIILSIMAGNKHVLLRTKEEDIAIVQNLAVLVSYLLRFSSALFIMGDRSRLYVSVKVSSPSPLPFCSRMSSSCVLDIYQHTWLRNPQTQDSTSVGCVSFVIRPIHLLHSLSGSAPRQDARKTLTFSSYLGKS
jgi:hypothetical protein